MNAHAHFPHSPNHSKAKTFRVALLGNPNCGKTALFNLLTGSRQKVANYAGVTVERKIGEIITTSHLKITVIDLPGAYSLNAQSLDETVTRDVVTGQYANEAVPDLLICVVDANHLQLNLRLVLEARQLGLPMALALNMSDSAKKAGLETNIEVLSDLLQMPVFETIAIHKRGADSLLSFLDQWSQSQNADLQNQTDLNQANLNNQVNLNHQTELNNQNNQDNQNKTNPNNRIIPIHEVKAVKKVNVVNQINQQNQQNQTNNSSHKIKTWVKPELSQVIETHLDVQKIVRQVQKQLKPVLAWEDRLDRFVLHPFLGALLLVVILFLMFQAVFSWAQLPMDLIQTLVDALAGVLKTHLPEGLLLSLLTDGVLAGAGSVLVFLPQIVILFFFILVLEDSGYLPRAAFLLDRLMGTVGLSGRSFIPLLSSFACAIPGVMATRTITDWRDRLVTIMIAPLMTCSARLPVYALLIGAFIPNQTVWSVFNLQGLILLGLYLFGIFSAMGVAAFAQWANPKSKLRNHQTPLLMELPSYRLPSLRQLLFGLWQRASGFVQRVGGIILALMILLWFLSSFPNPPENATEPAIYYSFAGQLGNALHTIFAPIGFNWQISVALVPGLAAREVAVGALGTVYAVAQSANPDDVAVGLSPLINQTWSLATALSLLVWYVFAPQCIATLATVRRETNSWRYAFLMAFYLFGLAYFASWATYRIASYFLA